MVPEAINYLILVAQSLLSGLRDIPSLETVPALNQFKSNLSISNFNADICPLDLKCLFNPGFEIDDSVKISILTQSFATLAKLISFNDTPICHSVMKPVLTLLKCIPLENVSKSVRLKLDAVAASLMEQSERHTNNLQPLQLQSRKRLAIKTFAPKFEINYAPNKHYDPDRERSQDQKMKREYKQEFRGAVRELRKDAVYLNKVRLNDKLQSDAKYKKKIDNIMGQLSTQEGAMRGYEREAKRAKGKKI
jgi:nucleolar protein 14